jgi:hypothetical protein
MTASAPTLPGVRAGSLCLGMVLAAVACWRFLPFTWALGMSLAALAVCALSARVLHGDVRWLWRFATLQALLAAALALAPSLPGLWPCDIGCGGGGGYSRLGHLPTVVVGLLAALVIPVACGVRALTSIRPGGEADRRSQVHQRIPPLVAAWGWLLLGGSAFFIVTALRLHLQCRQCGAFQTTSLALAAVLLGGPLAAWGRLFWLGCGVVLMTLCYGVALREDVQLAPPPLHPSGQPGPGPRPGPGALRDSELAWREHADAGRRWGSVHAPLVLELALDFQCPHCAEAYDQVMGAVQGALADGQLQLAIRTVVRPSEPASASLAAWSFAASASAEHQRFVVSLLGSREDATTAQLLQSPAAETIDLQALARLATQHQQSCQQLIDEDQERLHALGYRGATPFAVLLDRSGGVHGQWSGSIDHQALAVSIRTTLEAH